MKRKKLGFSLAEVLIAVTIAAIIATMGFTIAKKGVARAYDGYIFAGYSAISDAIYDAVNFNNGSKFTDCASLDPDVCNNTKRMLEMLSGRHVSYNAANNELDFDVPNGIHYKIYRFGARHGESALDENVDWVQDYRILMTVPSVKTRTGNTQSICMSYQIDSAYENILLPFSDDSSSFKDPHCTRSDMIPEIENRIDLLPFYIDDGRRGKTIAGVYQTKRYRPAKEAICRVYGRDIWSANELSSAQEVLFDCDGITFNHNDNSRDWEGWERWDAGFDTISNLNVRVEDPKKI